MQVITDPWAAAEYLFSYVSKEAHMEKDLVQKLAGCTCSTLEEARKVLLKAGNAVLSHRQIGKVEAAWLILGKSPPCTAHLICSIYVRNSFVPLLDGHCPYIHLFAIS